MTPIDAALLGGITLLAYTAQALTGFGSTMISVTLGALFLPIPLIMPVAVMLNIPFCSWMLAREHRDIRWPLFWREILPLMGLGLTVGVLSVASLDGINLKRPLGAVIVVLASLELHRLYMRRDYHPHALLRRALMLASGFMQGLYATGGPLLATAMAGGGLTRAERRMTMTLAWLVLNSALTIHVLASGGFSAEMLHVSAWLLPLTGIGLWAGTRLHERINENQFRFLLNLLLLASGAALIR